MIYSNYENYHFKHVQRRISRRCRDSGQKYGRNFKKHSHRARQIHRFGGKGAYFRVGHRKHVRHRSYVVHEACEQTNRQRHQKVPYARRVGYADRQGYRGQSRQTLLLQQSRASRGIRKRTLRRAYRRQKQRYILARLARIFEKSERFASNESKRPCAHIRRLPCRSRRQAQRFVNEALRSCRVFEKQSERDCFDQLLHYGHIRFFRARTRNHKEYRKQRAVADRGHNERIFEPQQAHISRPRGKETRLSLRGQSAD